MHRGHGAGEVRFDASVVWLGEPAGAGDPAHESTNQHEVNHEASQRKAGAGLVLTVPRNVTLARQPQQASRLNTQEPPLYFIEWKRLVQS